MRKMFMVLNVFAFVMMFFGTSTVMAAKALPTKTTVKTSHVLKTQQCQAVRIR